MKSLGHWSMRAKTAILRDSLTELQSNDNATAYMWKGLLWKAASGGQVEISREVFEMMKARGLVAKGDSSPFDALLKAQTVCGSTDVKEVVKVWREMREMGVGLQKRSFDLFARAFCRAGYRDVAERIRVEAESKGIQIDVEWPGAAISTPEEACLHLLKRCTDTCDVRTAERAVYDLSTKHRVLPTSRIWNELLNVYSVSLLTGPPPPIPPTHTHASPQGLPDPQGIHGVWHRIPHGMHNAWSYDVLLKACARSASRFEILQYAESVFREAHTNGLATEQHLWARLMEVCAESKETLHADNLAQQLLREMWAEGHSVKRDSRVMRAFERATSKWLEGALV
eukprot:TRINITY_DN6042_c0_g1_i1.p1 TRINITY_DN6042_c0_g1~~TRINITY_DN6042_c0_g1_i1.p1  ORF type:complete len:341 (+),score=52.23 TRINITY_DN6042_c0_g1_i1:296-1318(+)